MPTAQREYFTFSVAIHCDNFSVNHPKTRTAYAWSDADGNFTAVLGVPPATNPQNAVKVSIVAAGKKGKT